jgi:extracellular factor (EF) 3-hydroxypalmitic acid methyl ester biosynthesis protein
MIRKLDLGIPRNETNVSRISGRQTRTDESHLLLPPNFNRQDPEQCIRFLGHMADSIDRFPETTHPLGHWFRQLYGIMQVHRSHLDHTAWNNLVQRCREHRLAGMLREDALTKRAFEKPRGYAGDAELLDMMYGTEHCWSPPPMSELGQWLHSCTTVSSACMGVRSRRAIISEYLDQLAVRHQNADVLSLACGHLREAEISASLIRRRFGRFLAVDNDPLSLELVDREYGRFGVESIAANARETLSGRIGFSDFDFIYTSGLLDYLNESMGQRLALELFDRLNPGGQLLLTNFLPDIEGVGYMETFMDWRLIYRDRVDMMLLAERIPDRQIQQINVFSEENYNVVFLVIEKV